MMNVVDYAFAFLIFSMGVGVMALVICGTIDFLRNLDK